jgi:hypothetical protein
MLSESLVKYILPALLGNSYVKTFQQQRIHATVEELIALYAVCVLS